MLKESQEDMIQLVFKEIGSEKEGVESYMDSVYKAQQGMTLSSLDENSQSRLNKLLDERIFGKYKEDRQGFVEAVKEFAKTITYDQNNKINPDFSFEVKPSLTDSSVF